MANQQKSSNPLGNLGYIAMGILALVALFYAAKIAFSLIYIIAPILFIITLVMDYKVVTGYGKWIINLFKANPLYGIGASVLTFFAYPVVAIALFLKAMLNKKVKEVKQQFDKKKEGDYVEYEELPPSKPIVKKKTIIIEEEIISEEKLIELPPIKTKQAQTRSKNNNEYEDLFGD